MFIPYCKIQNVSLGNAGYFQFGMSKGVQQYNLRDFRAKKKNLSKKVASNHKFISHFMIVNTKFHINTHSLPR